MIFILHLKPGCNALGKDNDKTRRETTNFSEFVATYYRCLTVVLQSKPHWQGPQHLSGYVHNMLIGAYHIHSCET